MGMESAQAITQMGSGVAQYFQARTERKQLRTARDIELAQLRTAQRRIIGAQVAAVGASGIKLSGSPLQVINQTLYENELDLAVTREQYHMQIAQSELEGKLGLIEGFTGAAQTGVKAAPGVTSKLQGSLGTQGKNKLPIPTYGERYA